MLRWTYTHIFMFSRYVITMISWTRCIMFTFYNDGKNVQTGPTSWLDTNFTAIQCIFKHNRLSQTRAWPRLLCLVCVLYFPDLFDVQRVYNHVSASYWDTVFEKWTSNSLLLGRLQWIKSQDKQLGLLVLQDARATPRIHIHRHNVSTRCDKTTHGLVRRMQPHV